MGHRIVDNGRRVVRRGKEKAREEEKNRWRGRKSKRAGQCRLAEGTIQRAIVSRRFAVTSVGENLAESGRRRVVNMGLDDIGLQRESGQNQPDGETPPFFFSAVPIVLVFICRKFSLRLQTRLQQIGPTCYRPCQAQE